MAFDRRGSLPTTMPQQSMEGYLSLPPDRGTIIGRAIWKTRSDTEALAQFPLSLIADCQLQMLSHRKQGPVLPTMVVNVLPDPQLEKARKRRSSRTAGFANPRDNGPITLLFRPADEHPTLNDWARFIQSLIQPHVPERTPMSPLTPMSPIFTDPFSQRPRELADLPPRPGSGHGSRAGFSMKSSTQTYSTRERPLTFSDAPSLRSKRSDLSSQTSMMNQSQPGGFHHPFSGVVPADLPSPATTVGDYHGEFIEGWTSAQGRSSALSSPVRGRDNSIGSQTQVQPPAVSDPAPAPAQAPRETILDRAFQLRCIPGAEKEIPGEDKLSSLARFDALMKEMDEKRKQREAEEAKTNAESAAGPNNKTTSSELQSAFDVDSESGPEDADSDDDSVNFATDADFDDRFSSTSTQRAFDYMPGRYERVPRTPASPRIQSPRAPPTYNHEAFMALSSNASSSLPRPQTGYAKTRSRPAMSQRTHSQPQIATMMAGSSPNPIDTTADMEPATTGFSFTPGSPSVVHHHHHRHASAEKRQSTSSSKRLSFTEFTRRLSGASTLLGMQSNSNNNNSNAPGAASSRASHSDMDQLHNPPQSPPPHLHHLHPRAGAQTPRSPPPVGERERCVWRGSVGVFGGGGDGGFL
ncbi:hypothetical protein VTJ49DRAFT_4273 [Mycothermus thermophilus]|uniref:PH domain-containing protein n=1 Tax=Humicola insolens TaxID=85995 RepID=A0ABR3V5U9_HUMIN